MKNCSGCKTFLLEDGRYKACILKNAYSCPCEECIVKPMCGKKLSCIEFVRTCFYFNKNKQSLRQIYSASPDEVKDTLAREGFTLDL